MTGKESKRTTYAIPRSPFCQAGLGKPLTFFSQEDVQTLVTDDPHHRMRAYFQRLRSRSVSLTTDIRSHDTIKFGEDDLTFEWNPAAPVHASPEENIPVLPGFAFTAGKPENIGLLAATSVKLKWPGDAEDLVNRSLGNSLDANLAQLKGACAHPSPLLVNDQTPKRAPTT